MYTTRDSNTTSGDKEGYTVTISSPPHLCLPATQVLPTETSTITSFLHRILEMFYTMVFLEKIYMWLVAYKMTRLQPDIFIVEQ